MRELAAQARKDLKDDGKGKEESEDDLDQWREQALAHLRGGKKKGPLNTRMLQGWPEDVMSPTITDPQTGQTVRNKNYQRAELAGQTVDDLARDLRDFYTKPQSEILGTPTHFRLKHQYRVIT